MNTMTSFDWMLLASQHGWEDPGKTEPLDATVQRAKDFIKAKTPYPKFCHHPERCVGKGSCPREYCCCD